MSAQYMVTAEDAEPAGDNGTVYFGNVRENAEAVFAEWRQLSTARVTMLECCRGIWVEIATANN